MSEPTVIAEPLTPATEAAGDDPLRAFLSGKRQSERHACHVPVALEGLLDPVTATILDISHGGALVQIEEPAFLAAEAEGGVSAYLDLLSRHAAAGLTLRFPGRALSLPADIVRWTVGGGEQQASRVGLRFGRALSDGEIHALRTGTPACSAAEERAVEEAAPRVLPYAPRRGAMLQTLVFRALHPEHGPVVVGPVLGIAPDALALRAAGRRSLTELAGLLAGHDLLLAVQERGHTLWETIAHVTWVAPVADGSAVDIGLTAETTCGRALLKRLRRV